jgi:hypothetical protein
VSALTYKDDMPTSIGDTFLHGSLTIAQIIGYMAVPLACLRLMIYLTTKCDELSETGQSMYEPILFGAFILVLWYLTMSVRSYDTVVDITDWWIIPLLIVPYFAILHFSVDLFLRGPVERHCEDSCQAVLFGDDLVRVASQLNAKSGRESYAASCSAILVVILVWMLYNRPKSSGNGGTTSVPSATQPSTDRSANWKAWLSEIKQKGISSIGRSMKFAHHLPNTTIDPTVYPECSAPPL